MKQTVIPSVVGVDTGKADLGMLNLGNFSRGRRKTAQPHSITWDGTTYLVGKNAERFTRPIERMSFQRLSDGPDTRALTYAALGTLTSSGEAHYNLMVGFPVEVLKDAETGKRTLRTLRQWLQGSHEFVLDGEMYQVHIESIRAMAQPAGGFFAWGLDDNGSWVRAPQDLKALVGVCDIGFNTLDLFGVQGGQVLGEYTDGDTAGARRAAEVLMDIVQRQYGVRLSRHEADDYLRQASPILSCAAGDIDVTPIVRQALSVAAAGITDFINRRWERQARLRHKLFTGGGAMLFREFLTQEYPDAVLLPDSVTANALGLARYGRRVWKGAAVVGLDPGFGGFKAVLLS